jgi:hypothetical protein
MLLRERLLAFSIVMLVAVLSGCGSSTESVQSRQFQIVVDPSRPLANRSALYSMRASDDTAFLAYKYLWDFDDRYLSIKRELRSTDHVFNDTVAHNISCFAQDSLDHQIGEAHVYVRCIPASGTIAIHTADDSLDWQTKHFWVTVPNHTYSLVYEWDFGDSTIESFYDTVALHRYPSAGDYTFRLTVSEGAFAFARDSGVISVRQ